MPYLPKQKPKSWMPKKVEGQTRQYDNSSFYQSKQWRMTRNHYIKSNPLCEQCSRDNKTTGGHCVDHIKPVTKGGAKFDESNLQTLCNSCHAKKSAQEAVEYRAGVKPYKRKE